MEEQEYVIPNIEEQNFEFNFGTPHTDDTTDYLSKLGSAATSTFPGLTPQTSDQVKASVNSKEGEQNLRNGLANEEVREQRAGMDAHIQQRILEDVEPTELMGLLEASNRGPTPEQLAPSILERRAAKFLVDQGMANDERAAAVLMEEDFNDGTDTSTDIRQSFVKRLLRLQTIRQRLQEKLTNDSYAENALDIATMALVPGHTTATEAKVFGRGAETLADSVLNFSQNYWNTSDAEAEKIANQFEADIENNTVVGQNLFAALEQVNQVLTAKDEDAFMLNTTEVLDAIGIAGVLKGVKNISKVARIAGAPDVTVSRTQQIMDKIKANSVVSPTEQDEFVTNILPAIEPRRMTPEDIGNAQIALKGATSAPPATGTIRFYHGTTSNTADGFTGKTFVTPHQDYAKNYHGNNNNLLYTDMTKEEAIAKGLYDEINDFPINGSIEDGATRLKPLSSPSSKPQILPAIEGKRMSPAEIGDAQRRLLEPPEKPTGKVHSALDNAMMNEHFERALPWLLEEAERKGFKAYEEFEPVALLQALRGSLPPSVLNKTEQAAANVEAVKELLRRHMVDNDANNKELEAILDPESLTAGQSTPKNVPMYDVEIDDISGVRTANVYLGTGVDGLKGFTSEEAALEGAKRLGLMEGTYTVSDKTGQFFLKVSKNAGSTKFIKALNPEAEANLMSAYGRMIFGNTATASEDFVRTAKLATGMSSRVGQAMLNEANKIRKLYGQSRDSFVNLALDIQQKERWMSMRDVERWYVDNYNRLPSKKEREAYSAMVRLNAFHYHVTNARLRRHLTGTGYGEVKVQGVHKDFVTGKVVKGTSVDTHLVSILDTKDGKKHVFKNPDDLSRRLNEDDSVLVKTVFPDGNNVQYVIAQKNSVGERALRYNILRDTGGPRRMYDNTHWIKQQNIGKMKGQDVLYNPKTHFATKGIQESEAFAKAYNEALDAYKAAKASGSKLDELHATNIINKNTRYSSFKEFDEAVTSKQILDTPFEVVKDGQLPSHRLIELEKNHAIDPDFANLPDDIKEMVENRRLFDSPRGPRLPHPTEGHAPLLHPNEILSKAMDHALHTSAMDAFRTRRITQWVNTYGMHLQNKSGSFNERFMNGALDDKGLSPLALATAEAERNAIKRMLATPTTPERHVSQFRDYLVDLIDNKVNAGAADRFANLSSKDPLAAARGIAVNMFLGVWNPSMLLVQASMMPGVIATSPKNGLIALAAYPMMRAALLAKKHTKYFGQLNEKLTALGMKRDTFQAMMKDLDKSGFDIVDANIGDLDNMSGMTTIRGWTNDKLRQVGRSSRFIFNEAEKTMRLTAFAIAWLDEFNKGKTALNAERMTNVMVKANALSFNMMRDSKAWWQTGYTQNITQLSQFPVRAVEVMFAGTKGGLTGKERIRMYMGLAAAYGASLGAGSGSLAAFIREQYKNATGEEANETYVKAITEGMIGAVFSDTDMVRMQPFGQQFLLYDLLQDGFDVSDFFGPVGNIASKFYNATLGSMKLKAFLSGDIREGSKVATLKDIANDFGKIASSYNNLDRAFKAAQYNKLFSNNTGALLQDDLDEFDAVMLGLGFPPRNGREAWDASQLVNDWQKTANKDATIIANYMKEGFGLDENDPRVGTLFDSAQHQIDLYRNYDETGQMSKYLEDAIRREMNSFQPLNEEIEERFNRIFDKNYRKIVRE